MERRAYLAVRRIAAAAVRREAGTALRSGQRLHGGLWRSAADDRRARARAGWARFRVQVELLVLWSCLGGLGVALMALAVLIA
ncbi:MAG: hypothetical protein EA355_09560 [Rhodobacteraceae bacterium]|nr:MAG: hypothetical protein EA355_09560 [Paracoccaceae bacterium]